MNSRGNPAEQEVRVIDPRTGEVIVQSPPARLGPTLTRSDFLSSPLAQEQHRKASFDKHQTFDVGPVVISGRRFLVRLYFFNARLTEIHLVADTNGTGLSWDSWSAEAELERKKLHDRWVESVLGRGPHRYPWGEVLSVYDDRGGFSEIIIRYLPGPWKSR